MLVQLCLLALLAPVPAFRLNLPKYDDTPCDGCDPGWGVTKLCDVRRGIPTTCNVCMPGSWSPAHKHQLPCMPCSICGKNMYQISPCGSTADTQCGLCDDPSGVPTNDFLLKCIDEPMFFEDEIMRSPGDIAKAQWYSYSLPTLGAVLLLVAALAGLAFCLCAFVRRHRTQLHGLQGGVTTYIEPTGWKTMVEDEDDEVTQKLDDGNMQVNVNPLEKLLDCDHLEIANKHAHA